MPDPIVQADLSTVPKAPVGQQTVLRQESQICFSNRTKGQTGSVNWQMTEL